MDNLRPVQFKLFATSMQKPTGGLRVETATSDTIHRAMEPRPPATAKAINFHVAVPCRGFPPRRRKDEG